MTSPPISYIQISTHFCGNISGSPSFIRHSNWRQAFGTVKLRYAVKSFMSSFSLWDHIIQWPRIKTCSASTFHCHDFVHCSWKSRENQIFKPFNRFRSIKNLKYTYYSKWIYVLISARCMHLPVQSHYVSCRKHSELFWELDDWQNSISSSMKLHCFSSVWFRDMHLIEEDIFFNYFCI